MDIKSLTPEELEELRIEVAVELERRANLEAIPEQVAQLARTYTAGGGDKETLQAALDGEPGEP